MQKETCGIYVITERATQRAIYVGQSIGIEGRWGAYKNRFPKERFDYRIIQECLPAELNFWEKYYICALKTHWTEAGENQNWGGQHWPRPEEPRSPASRAKQSASLKGRVRGPMSEEERAKRSAAMKGRVKGPLSEERKAKQSAVMKGRVRGPMSEEEKAKRSAAAKIRIRSEEEKAKRSAALKGKTKGRVQSEEEKAKRRGKVPHNKGKPMSEEQKKKLSEANKAHAALKRAAKAAAVAAFEALLFTETETILSPE
jgi:hypothetical protein